MVERYLDNALKFTAAGRVAVNLDLRAIEADAVELEISVLDTGPGIDAAVAGRLFRRFSPADDSRAKAFSGGGLGPCDQPRTDGAHGRGRSGWRAPPARVRASGCGSACPWTRQAPTEGDASWDEAEEAGPLRVLYADDHENNRVLVRTLLESQGHSCDTVCDGEEAVEAMRIGAYDLVLMDIQMPIKDGLAAAIEIRGFPYPLGGRADPGGHRQHPVRPARGLRRRRQ